MNKQIRQVFLFANGSVAVTDSDGNQIPELQGPIHEVLSELFAQKGFDTSNTQFNYSNGYASKNGKYFQY